MDIGAQRIKTSISLMLIPIAGRQIVHVGCEQRGSHFLPSAQRESITINIACVSNVHVVRYCLPFFYHDAIYIYNPNGEN